MTQSHYTTTSDNISGYSHIVGKTRDFGAGRSATYRDRAKTGSFSSNVRASGTPNVFQGIKESPSHHEEDMSCWSSCWFGIKNFCSNTEKVEKDPAQIAYEQRISWYDKTYNKMDEIFR